MRILVRGMTTPHCVSSVASALRLIGGVAEVEVSLERGEALIAYDPSKAAAGQFQTAIRAVGFKPATAQDARVAA